MEFASHSSVSTHWTKLLVSLPSVSFRDYIQYFYDHYSPHLNHIIVKAEFIDKVLFEDFDFINVGCFCVCSSLDKAHYHFIGAFRGHPNTLVNRFKAWRTIPTTKGSNRDYKCIKLKTIPHYWLACFYITRQQPIASCKGGGYKHSDFLPFGLTPIATNQTFEYGAQWKFWQSVYATMRSMGLGFIADECEQQYGEYKQRQQDAANFRRREYCKKSVARCANTQPKSSEGIQLRTNAVSRWRKPRVCDSLYQSPIPQQSETVDTKIPPESMAELLGRLNPDQQKELFGLLGTQQLRQVVSSSDVNSVNVDNGNVRSS